MMFGKKTPQPPISAPAPMPAPLPMPASTPQATSNAMVQAAAVRDKQRKKASAAGGLMLPPITPGQSAIHGTWVPPSKTLG